MWLESARNIRVFISMVVDIITTFTNIVLLCRRRRKIKRQVHKLLLVAGMCLVFQLAYICSLGHNNHATIICTPAFIRLGLVHVPTVHRLPCGRSSFYLQQKSCCNLFFSFLLEHKRCMTTWLVFPSDRERISQSGMEPLTTLFGLGTSPVLSGSLGSSQTTNFCVVDN